MQDRYPEAAVRHYRDGVILHQEKRYDNAMCHYAFSAECAIKAFEMQFEKIKNPSVRSRISHDVEPFWEALLTYNELLGIMDSRMSLIIGVEAPPPTLFYEHPTRRYGNDVSYTDVELSACKAFTARLVQHVIAAAIDGRLEYRSEREVPYGNI
jgi:hypothetical protein